MKDANENKNETIIALKMKLRLIMSFLEYEDTSPINRDGMVRLPIVYQI